MKRFFFTKMFSLEYSKLYISDIKYKFESHTDSDNQYFKCELILLPPDSRT